MPNRLRPVLVDGVQGLGDNLFQRAAVKALAATGQQVFVKTSWPQFYRDLPGVSCVRPVTRLRTQAKNVKRAPAHFWQQQPRRAQVLRTLYGDRELRSGTIAEFFTRAVGLAPGHPLDFDLPDDFEAPPLVVPADRPLAVVRPVTVRAEWRNEARNPDPVALAEVCRHIRRTHYLVSVADLELGKEWAVPPLPEADLVLHAGQLPVDQLLGLVAAADLVVGGVGWLVPAAACTGTPTFVLLGGMGAHNAPEVVTDPRMVKARIGFAWPPHFCRCALKLHDCQKEIPDAVRQFEDWFHLLATGGGGLEPARPAAVAA